MSLGYHVTTPKRLARYQATGAILPPVRWWSTLYSAGRWARKTGRTLVLEIELPPQRWPLPIRGGAYWSDQPVRRWRVHRVDELGSWLKSGDRAPAAHA